MGFISDIFGGSSNKTNVQVPPRTPEENALMAEQTSLLREQRTQLETMLKQQNLLQPYLFSELGIRPVTDASGNVTGYEKAPLTAEQQQQSDIDKRLRELTLGQLEVAGSPESKEIQQRLQQRSLAALKGELPVDPSLTRSLEEGERQLHAQLRANLGPGYATSTPGIQALADFQKRKSELIYGASRDELTLGEQLSGARSASTIGTASGVGGINTGVAGISQSRLADVFKSSTLALPAVGMVGTNAAGYAGPLSSLFQNRQLATQGSIASAGYKTSSSNATTDAFAKMMSSAMSALFG